VPSKIARSGRISIVCPYCNYVIAEYSLSDEPLKKTSKHKFAGSPMPSRARYVGGELDDGIVICPHCKRPFRPKLWRVYILKVKEFDEAYVYDPSTGRYVERSPELFKPVEETLETTYSITENISEAGNTLDDRVSEEL